MIYMTNDRNAKTVKFTTSQVAWITEQKAKNIHADDPSDRFYLSALIRTLLAVHIAAVEVKENGTA